MSPSWLPFDFFRFHPAEKFFGRTPQLHTTRIFLGLTEPCRASRAAPSPPSHAKPTKLCSLPRRDDNDDDHDHDHYHEEDHDDHDDEGVGEVEQQ